MDKETHSNNTVTIERTTNNKTEKTIRLTSGDSEVVFVSNDKKDSIEDMSNHAEKIFNNIVKKTDLDYIG